jgi:hypothetical protein
LEYLVNHFAEIAVGASQIIATIFAVLWQTRSLPALPQVSPNSDSEALFSENTGFDFFKRHWLLILLAAWSSGTLVALFSSPQEINKPFIFFCISNFFVCISSTASIAFHEYMRGVLQKLSIELTDVYNYIDQPKKSTESAPPDLIL